MMNEDNFNPPGIDRLTEIETASSVAYTSDLIEIEGIVSSRGQSRSRGKYNDKGYDVLFVSFDAWRRPGQAIVENKLLLLRAVALDAEFSKELVTGSIHRFSALLSIDEKRAIIWQTSKQPADTNELTDIAEELAKPVIISTQRFGDMTLDRRLDWFNGEIMWGEKTIDLTIQGNESSGVEAGLQVAELLYTDQASWSKKVSEYAIENMLVGYNDGWKLDEEPIMTPEQFLSRITLTAIQIDSQGRFTFWHDDGEIFGGHSIEIAGTVDNGLNHGDMPG